MFVDVSELAGTRVMVTGATSGLGAAMATALSAAGARVVVTSRRLSRAQAAAQRLGPDALGLELDVRDEAAVSAAVGEVWDRLGGLDVLVNLRSHDQPAVFEVEVRPAQPECFAWRSPNAKAVRARCCPHVRGPGVACPDRG
jgi:NAD(P)-dependent dehydrogenase (short-subunit alcohol dehydrogenase family)